ncbi:copper amine oxidase N-terminal domain-containing protein [Paenibacillus guangzhouensis]|uniref:copper amine oxidase N-terminal domain-containing protein n=1 Tax=Paenibacillus guangzhouensis TaxID=1473112 RepID=UPI001D0FAD29|nr:copper amine oxidase N-terminal domain-containing protein [Paenibacillus guangzhouensis]
MIAKALIAAAVIAITFMNIDFPHGSPNNNVALAAAKVNRDITVLWNGKPLKLESAPVLRKGIVFLPMRELFNVMGAEIAFNKGHIDVHQADHYLGLDVDSLKANVDGSNETLHAAPFYSGGRTYISLDLLSQAFGAKEKWDPKSQQADIRWKGPDILSFQPGIAINFPKGSDADEKEVILLVKKAMQAIAGKVKSDLRSTMDENADYLDFLIESKIQYRFTQLVRIEPYDESTGRKNSTIAFYTLNAGIIKHGNYIFTSLKNKQGKWYIANID